MRNKLVLTGFMATGKSVVGHALAHRLKWPLIDTDHEIVSRAGKTVEEIFSAHGEPHFRQLERDLIAELCASPTSAIIATGGGALVDEQNFESLSRLGIIVCLTSHPKVIAARISKSPNKRPKLLEGGKPLLERIAELIAARANVYARADFSVDTSEISVEQAAQKILVEMEARGAIGCRRSA